MTSAKWVAEKWSHWKNIWSNRKCTDVEFSIRKPNFIFQIVYKVYSLMITARRYLIHLPLYGLNWIQRHPWLSKRRLLCSSSPVSNRNQPSPAEFLNPSNLWHNSVTSEMELNFPSGMSRADIGRSNPLDIIDYIKRSRISSLMEKSFAQ